MANADKGYNGWTNYETWAVKLWMDNNQGDYDYWRETTRETWNAAQPTRVLSRSEHARAMLADGLKMAHDSESDHPVFKAADGSVYADLLNAALSEVNWYEIAGSLLEDMNENSDDDSDRYEARA